MFSGMCDEVGRGDISHTCCNVDTVKGSVKHIMFGTAGAVRTLRLAITVLWSDKPSTTVGVWMFFARGASYYDVEPMTMYVCWEIYMLCCVK